jgi:hypothetical protein
VSSQVVRTSPFSIWGQADLGPGQLIAQILAGALAVLVAFVPRRRSLGQIAGLGAAVLIAVQLTADHWFYLYIPWFFPLAIAAMAAAERQSYAATMTCSIEDARPSAPISTATAFTQTSPSALSKRTGI